MHGINLKKTAIRQKRNYDARARDRPPFDVGDLVRYYYTPVRQQNKFARPWTGPWLVVARPTLVDYEITLVSNPKKKRTVHMDQLKPFEGYPESSTDDDVPSQKQNTDNDVVHHSPPRSDTNVSDNPLDDLADLFNPRKGRLDTSSCDSDHSDKIDSSSDDVVPSSPRRRRKLRPRHGLRKPKRYQS